MSFQYNHALYGVQVIKSGLLSRYQTASLNLHLTFIFMLPLYLNTYYHNPNSHLYIAIHFFQKHNKFSKTIDLLEKTYLQQNSQTLYHLSIKFFSLFYIL